MLRLDGKVALATRSGVGRAVAGAFAATAADDVAGQGVPVDGGPGTSRGRGA